jgi:hypothetical protein
VKESLTDYESEESEKQVLVAFLRWGVLKGLYVTEVPIGSYYPRRIDSVCIEMRDEELENLKDFENPTEYVKDFRLGFKQFEKRSVWLLEVKQKLDSSALGQILIYKHYFERIYHDTILKGVGIVCKESDSMIEEVCQEYNVHVYEIPIYFF